MRTGANTRLHPVPRAGAGATLRTAARIVRTFVGCGVLAATLLAGCTKLDDSLLPDGTQPVIFTATMEGQSAVPAAQAIKTTTRATTDNSWSGNEEVAVQIGAEVKKYNVTTAANGTLIAASDVTPFYWQNTSETKTVSAWYCGTGYTATQPTVFTVQSDQNKDEDYQKSDFLYASPTDIAYKGSKSLKFYHQTAKVVINIRNKGVLTNAQNLKSVVINAVASGTFTAPTSGNNYGLSASGTSGQTVQITPKKLATPNSNVAFESGSSAETALASYEALVIPQTVAASSSLFTITLDGYSPFSYKAPAGGITWTGGQQYTYNLTIKGSEVTATVAASIGWTQGTSGSGSAEI